MERTNETKNLESGISLKMLVIVIVIISVVLGIILKSTINKIFSQDRNVIDGGEVEARNEAEKEYDDVIDGIIF